MSYPGHLVGRRVLSLCRDAVGIFYSPPNWALLLWVRLYLRGVHYTFHIWSFAIRYSLVSYSDNTPGRHHTISKSLNQGTHDQWFVQWFPTWGITHYFTDTQCTTDRLGTNTDLGQLQAQEKRVCMTLSIVCILRETSTKPRGMLTHLWLPPSADRPSPGLLSQADRPPLPCFVNWLSVFSGTFLPSSTSGLAGDLVLSSLCVFRAKTDKEIVWVAPTQTKRIATHHVTILRTWV